MKSVSAISINLKKLRHRFGKAVFLIIPITTLVALGVIISSQTNNIQKALNQYVFSKIKDESTVLNVAYQTSQDNLFNPASGNRNSITIQSGFTNSDLSKISSIANVTDASIDYTVPVTNIETTDLFAGKTIKISQMIALKDSMSSIYTKENFTYNEGDTVIPIVINPNALVNTYEDWGGKNSISVDFTTMRPQRGSTTSGGTTAPTPGQDPLSQNSPIKTEAIQYNKDDLIGKTFTIKFGGFSSVQDFTITRDNSLIVFTKSTQDEITTSENAIKSAVNQYWNYDKLASGLTYTFKIVGVVETQGDRSMYVPESFAQSLMQKYIQNQISAQNGTAIPTSVLSSTYTGLEYDGTEILSQGGRFGRFGGGAGSVRVGFGPGEQGSGSTAQTYAIPGLVIKVSDQDQSTVEGLVTDPSIYASTAKRGDTVTVKINDVASRTDVVSQLNKLGYAYQDINDLSVFSEVQSTLNNISTGLIISFIVLTSAIIIITMSKFVSESTKEIGIFRAVGFTKGNILLIYMLQAFIYTGFGYLLGLGIGVVSNSLLSSVVSNWFSNFVKNTINQTVNVASVVSKNTFTGLNGGSILLLSVTLLVLTIIISFIPALKASSVSPVEAIKSE